MGRRDRFICRSRRLRSQNGWECEKRSRVGQGSEGGCGHGRTRIGSSRRGTRRCRQAQSRATARHQVPDLLVTDATRLSFTATQHERSPDTISRFSCVTGRWAGWRSRLPQRPIHGAQERKPSGIPSSTVFDRAFAVSSSFPSPDAGWDPAAPAHVRHPAHLPVTLRVGHFPCPGRAHNLPSGG